MFYNQRRVGDASLNGIALGICICVITQCFLQLANEIHAGTLKKKIRIIMSAYWMWIFLIGGTFFVNNLTRTVAVELWREYQPSESYVGAALFWFPIFLSSCSLDVALFLAAYKSYNKRPRILFITLAVFLFAAICAAIVIVHLSIETHRGNRILTGMAALLFVFLSYEIIVAFILGMQYARGLVRLHRRTGELALSWRPDQDEAEGKWPPRLHICFIICVVFLIITRVLLIFIGGFPFGVVFMATTVIGQNACMLQLARVFNTDPEQEPEFLGQGPVHLEEEVNS